jgi:hypothetical protein
VDSSSGSLSWRDAMKHDFAAAPAKSPGQPKLS